MLMQNTQEYGDSMQEKWLKSSHNSSSVIELSNESKVISTILDHEKVEQRFKVGFLKPESDQRVWFVEVPSTKKLTEVSIEDSK